MNTGLLIVAHAPLASALRQCVLHVFPEAEAVLLAIDVQPNVPPEETLEMARHAMQLLDTPQTLVLCDVFGATPCNVAQKLVDGPQTRLITGVNLPMLLRTVSYRQDPLDALVTRALAGGTQGVMQIASSKPQNQAHQPTHDQDHRHHQQ